MGANSYIAVCERTGRGGTKLGSKDFREEGMGGATKGKASDTKVGERDRGERTGRREGNGRVPLAMSFDKWCFRGVDALFSLTLTVVR